ncbi:MAG: glycosyltransferase family A protein [Planctomycetota bacterium]
MSATPRVSVVMPVRDGAAYLAAAIESVLAQDVPPHEVIVVDDGSTDGSGAIAARAGGPVRVLAGRFGGAAAARNAGVAASSGDVLAFLDHDDLWTAGRLGPQLAALAREPRVELVLGLTQRVRGDGGVLAPLGPPAAEMSLGAALLTRTVFDRIGPLDTARRFDEDVDWFLRAREAGVAARLHPVLVQLYRRHATNATRDRAGDVRSFFAVLRDSLARRRAADGTVRALPEWPAPEPT